MKTKRPRSSNRKTYYLVLWWMSQTPYAAIFENEVAAEAAANVRNALMVTISGRDAKVDLILDWYRRDESGRPMPAEIAPFLVASQTEMNRCVSGAHIFFSRT